MSFPPRPMYQLQTLWFKDDVPIELSGITFSFNGLWNRTLSLLQADLNYAGLYRCQVRLLSSIDEPLQAEAYVTIHGTFSDVSHYMIYLLSKVGNMFSCMLEGKHTNTFIERIRKTVSCYLLLSLQMSGSIGYCVVQHTKTLINILVILKC